MSQQDVELARRAFEAWNEGRPGAFDDFWAEDIEFHDPPDLPDSRTVRGRDAVTAHLEKQVEVIGDMKVTIVDVEERGAAYEA